MVRGADGEVKQRTFASLRMVMKAMVELLGPSCEVVFHDMSGPESSIIAIEGDVTGRRVGGRLTDVGLACLRFPNRERVYNHTTVGEGGRVVKSASVFLSDDEGDIFGALCIKLDMTPFLAFHQHLHSSLLATDSGRPVSSYVAAEGEEVAEAVARKSLTHDSPESSCVRACVEGGTGSVVGIDPNDNQP